MTGSPESSLPALPPPGPEFDAACEEAFEAIFTPFEEAYAVPGPWAGRLEAGLAALLSAIAKQPELGELCLVRSQAGQSDRRTYRRAVAALAAALCEATSAQDVPLLGEELLAGGVVALIAARLGAGESEGLEALTPQLVRLLAPPLELEAAAWGAPAIPG